jgi:hypothetical protein
MSTLAIVWLAVMGIGCAILTLAPYFRRRP